MFSKFYLLCIFFISPLFAMDPPGPPCELGAEKTYACSNCGKIFFKTMRCQSCKTPYCAKYCQIAHWPQHKSSCVAFKKSLEKATTLLKHYKDKYKCSHDFAPWMNQRVSYEQIQAAVLANDVAQVQKFLIYFGIEAGRSLMEEVAKIASELINILDFPFHQAALLELVGYGECGEFSRSFIVALMKEEIPIITEFWLTYKGIIHVFLGINDHGIEHVVDPYFNFIGPLDDFKGNRAILSYMSAMSGDSISIIQEEIIVVIKQTYEIEQYAKCSHLFQTGAPYLKGLAEEKFGPVVVRLREALAKVSAAKHMEELAINETLALYKDVELSIADYVKQNRQ